MTIIQKPTNKFSNTSYAKDLVIIHKTLGTYPSDLNWLAEDKPHTKKDDWISSNYYINKLGHIYQLVADDKMAWHAGRVYSPSVLARKILKPKPNGGFINPNRYSIGIEFESKKGEAWTESQMLAGTWLIRKLGISTILTHHEITSYKPKEMTEWRDEILKRLNPSDTKVEQARKLIKEALLLLDEV